MLFGDMWRGGKKKKSRRESLAGITFRMRLANQRRGRFCSVRMIMGFDSRLKIGFITDERRKKNSPPSQQKKKSRQWNIRRSLFNFFFFQVCVSYLTEIYIRNYLLFAQFSRIIECPTSFILIRWFWYFRMDTSLLPACQHRHPVCVRDVYTENNQLECATILLFKSERVDR